MRGSREAEFAEWDAKYDALHAEAQTTVSRVRWASNWIGVLWQWWPLFYERDGQLPPKPSFLDRAATNPNDEIELGYDVTDRIVVLRVFYQGHVNSEEFLVDTSDGWQVLHFDHLLQGNPADEDWVIRATARWSMTLRDGLPLQLEGANRYGDRTSERYQHDDRRLARIRGQHVSRHGDHEAFDIAVHYDSTGAVSALYDDIEGSRLFRRPRFRRAR